MRLFLLQNGSLNLVRNLSPDLLITVRINLLCCGFQAIANDNHRIKMIKVSIMSLELVVHSTTMRSGYFHFGNNHFFVKFQLFKYVLKIFDDSRDSGHKQYSGGYVNAIQDLISWEVQFVPLSPIRRKSDKMQFLF